MAAGDILKEALLVVENFTVKSNEDIEKGELGGELGQPIEHRLIPRGVLNPTRFP